MDAYLGGDIYGVLKREGALTEQAARFCAACVLEAFDYLHSNEIVYRDLKPENLMIDHTYVPVVCDHSCITICRHKIALSISLKTKG